MLEGITVLNEFTTHIFNSSAFVFSFLGISVILLIVFGIVALVTNDEFWGIVGVAMIIPSLLIGVACGDCFFATEETRYQVTINEEVSMTEFNERYETIKQDGQIFTIRERNDEDVAG